MSGSYRAGKSARKQAQYDSVKSRTCNGKQCHLDETRATVAMERLKAAGKGQESAERGILHVYECKICGCWHYGHTRRPIEVRE